MRRRPTPATATWRTSCETDIDRWVLRFAGRPVAIMARDGAATRNRSPTSLADHLGTPVLASDETGAVVWSGGFEPFGGDWNGAESAGVFLRFPGQWRDDAWNDVDSDVSYNLHRWYASSAGRYSRPDPIGIAAAGRYSYVGGNTTRYSDPAGLCRVEVRFNQIGLFWHHAYIVSTDPNGLTTYFRGGPEGEGSSSAPTAATGGSSSQSCCGSSSGGSSGSSSGSSNSSNSSSPGSSPGAPNRGNGPFGALVGTTGEYRPGTIDWTPEPVPSSTLLDNDCSCELWNRCLRNNLLQIEASGIPYNPFSSNSNATITEIARNCGLSPPRKPPAPVWAPGWNTDLIP